MTRAVRQSLLSLFLAALLAVRLTSPFGFMPGQVAGKFALVECPDAFPIAAAHHGMAHGDQDTKAKPVCPFAAGMAPAGPLPDLAEAVAPVEWPADRDFAPPPTAGPPAVRIAPRPPSRAPPQA